MKKILILGGKGTASVIAHSIIHANDIGYNKAQFVGYVNDNENEIEGYPVIGKFSEIKDLVEQGYYFINTVYKMGGQDERIEKFEGLNIPDERLFTFIHPLSYVASTAELGPGCVVLANSAISPSTKIGKCCLVLNNVNIGHDNIIGNYVKFTANSSVGGDLIIGDGSWFGLNCTVRGKLKIGEKSVVGIGAVVTKNIGNNEIWVGNPAKFHKSTSDSITM